MSPPSPWIGTSIRPFVVVLVYWAAPEALTQESRPVETRPLGESRPFKTLDEEIADILREKRAAEPTPTVKQEDKPSTIAELQRARAELDIRMETIEAEALRVGKEFLAERRSRMSSRAAEATQALLELREAESALRRAARRAEAAINGAIVVGGDGTPLGKVASKFEIESIANEFGEYGSRFAERSIWNRFGKYGSTFDQYSPFCSFGVPPRIILDNTVVGVLTESIAAFPVGISPNALGRMLGRKIEE